MREGRVINFDQPAWNRLRVCDTTALSSEPAFFFLSLIVGSLRKTQAS